MAAPSNWDSYFQQCGLDPAKLKEQRIVELKCGDKQIQFPFSMEQFLMQYITQSQKPFSPDNLAKDVLATDVRFKQAMFLEGSPVQKIKKGVFSKKPTPHPDRQFLLFKDEYLKEIPAPNNKIAQKAGNLWPFHYLPPPMESIIAAGKAYSTGKRIIFDAFYTENDSEFATMQVLGKIDFRNCLQIFDKPYFILQSIKEDNKTQEPFNAVGIATEIERECWQEGIRVLGVKTIGISGTEMLYSKINLMLKAPDGGKALQTYYRIYGANAEFDNALQNLSPINLEDILAMRQYASNGGYFEATPFGLRVEKKKANLLA